MTRNEALARPGRGACGNCPCRQGRRAQRHRRLPRGAHGRGLGLAQRRPPAHPRLRPARVAGTFVLAAIASAEISMRFAWPRTRQDRVSRDLMAVWLLPIALLLPPGVRHGHRDRLARVPLRTGVARTAAQARVHHRDSRARLRWRVAGAPACSARDHGHQRDCEPVHRRQSRRSFAAPRCRDLLDRELRS